MNALRKLRPSYPLPAAEDDGTRFHREMILQAMLIIICGLGLPAVVLAVLESLQEASYLLAVLYGSIYTAFLGMTVFRKLPYGLRSGLVVGAAYLLALSELFESGQLGDVRMFLIVFVAMCAVLYPYRFVIGAILLGLLTIVVTGLYASLSPHPSIGALANINQGTGWGTSSVVFLMLAVMLAGSISMLIAKLEANVKQTAGLAGTLKKERDVLDQRIQERTRILERRLVQLNTASEISQAISALSDQDALLRQITDIVKARFDLYYVGVFLIDQEMQSAVLKAGTGEAGEQMVASGHRLAVGGSSMIGWCTANRLPRIALDVGAEAVRFKNPFLPLTRSELALPIVAHNEVLGAMTVQSERPNAFDENDIGVLQSIAGSLAIALENAFLYQEMRESLDEVRLLNRDYLQRAWSEAIFTAGDLDRVYDFTKDSSGKASTQTTLSVPLLLREEEIGQISLELEKHVFSDEEKRLVENIASQTAIALENARLLQETERRAFQEQKLNEVGSKFLLARSMDEILRVAAQELGQLPKVTQAAVRLDGSQDFSKDDFIPDQTTIQVVPAGPGEGSAQASLAIPIQLRGQKFGMVEVQIADAAIAQGMIDLVEGIVSRLAVSLENTRLLDEISQRAEWERKVGDISSKVRAATDVDSVLKTAIQEIGQSFGASEVIVQLRRDY